MKGLMLKDLYNSQKNIRFYLIFMLLFAVAGYLMKMSGYTLVLQAVVAISLGISLFSYDEYSHWDMFALILPVDRKTVVRARYLLCFLLCAVTALLCLTISSLTAFLLHEEQMEVIISCYSCFFVSVLLLAIMFPCIYKMGAEKARIILLVLGGGFGVACASIASFGDEAEALFHKLDTLNPFMVIIVLTAVVFGGYYFSYRASVRIYQTKEF
ncbi:MAG: ABC-2 transporter permease [Lachnospiraceae bacterium]|jgi:ABC-2 type transport system permease protein